jgi:hypothetical protein
MTKYNIVFNDGSYQLIQADGYEILDNGILNFYISGSYKTVASCSNWKSVVIWEAT